MLTLARVADSILVVAANETAKPSSVRVFTMIGLDLVGQSCKWPMEAYNPHDLSPEGHEAIRQRIIRAAKWWGMDDDSAEEAGSQFYAHWLGRKWGTTGIGRGDHFRAVASILAYAKRSHFHGFTGQRRQARGKRVERGSDGLPVRVSVRKACAAELAQRERLRERNNPTPESVAVAVERIAKTPMHSKKAYRLAKRIGLPGVRELVREACGFAAE